MTSIDQRILIPAPPNMVWEYISKLDNNPDWQVDCASIIYLSQRRKGIGARWRHIAPNRQEYVYEISAWYEGLGYEYIHIDGGGFKETSGRVRLQEIAEGTIVQWTFNYDLTGGVLGGLRNALSTQRRIEKIMVDSLKTLWKQTKRKGSLEGYQARSLMQDGPQDPDSRAQYRSRHPSITPLPAESDVPLQPVSPSLTSPVIPEPPISDEDTRPRPAVANAQTLPPDSVPTPQSNTTSDQRFAPPQPTTSSTHDSPPPAIEHVTPDNKPTQTELMSPLPLAEPTATPKEPEKPNLEITAPKSETIPTTPEVTPDTPEPAPITPPSTEDFGPKVTPDTDTTEMSIWEVFGIPSPTDTQRMRAIQAAQIAEEEYKAEEETHHSTDTSASDPQPSPTITDTPHTVSTNDISASISAKLAAEEPPPPEGATERFGYRTQSRRRSVRVRRPGVSKD